MSKSAHTAAGIAAQAERINGHIGAIRRVLRRPLEAEEARGDLTMPQSAVMRVVVRSQGISLKDLSREVSLSHSTVSGIADRLQKRGMIERRPDPQDGRITRIYPTPIVTEFVRERIPALSRGPLEAALARASAQERAGIEKALDLLRQLLEKS